MTYEFKIEKIVRHLERYKSHLSNLYKWNANIVRLIDLKILSGKQVEELNKLTPYQKEINLKQIIGQKLNDALKNNISLFYELSLWIIKDWGGIKGAKDIDTIESVKNFLKQDKPSFKRIASASKVGAYLQPDKNVIYDSRVVYSLNWIILSEKAGQFFFPIPEGRNSKMSALDLNVLIWLKNINNYRSQTLEHLGQRLFIKNADKRIFIPEKDAYTELNKLIRLINKKLWENDKEKSDKLFYSEMLLFSIADRDVFQDITQKLTLKFEVNNES